MSDFFFKFLMILLLHIDPPMARCVKYLVFCLIHIVLITFGVNTNLKQISPAEKKTTKRIEINDYM